MRPFLLLLSSIFLPIASFSTTTISGNVMNAKGQPVAYANIILKDTYDGASTDDKGNYSFSTDETGTFTLICRCIGYLEETQQITLNGSAMTFNFVLHPTVNELDVVTISAGTIEASDEKRTTVLKPLDIVTTAGGNGDIYGAVQTLPGATRVGNQEGLFVRGGTGAETKTIIDGLNVNNPFFTSLPDVAARGRFSPFLFKGTVFSTGGYSAQYGQALSSALVLETQDMPDQTESSLAVTSVGFGGGHEHLWSDKHFSAGFDLNYTNLAPYFLAVPQKQDYTKMPQFLGGSANFRKMIGESGMLKFYGYFNYANMGFTRPDIDSTNGYRIPLELQNSDAYTNLSFRNYIGDKWRFDIATSCAFDHNEFNTGDTIRSYDALSQGKVMGTRYFSKRDQLRFGGEYQYATDKGRYNQYENYIFDNFMAGFAETDVFIGTKFVARMGGRFEHSTYLNRSDVAPRASLAMKAGKNNQLSLAYGDFYQKPSNDILYATDSVNYERATHYIASFQHVDDSITLRIEAYYKKYDDLVVFYPYSNNGFGYAQGFDVFWRDKKTFRNVDYWISYTYVDTKRIYRDMPIETMPEFATTHNASVVVKKWFPKITTSVGFSYFYSSGRPYFNPERPVSEYLADKTYDFHSINMNASYLTTIHGAFTVFVISVTNVPGFNNVYGYRYSYDALRRESIVPPAKRSFFLGMFMSFGRDRSQDVINSNN